MQVTFSGSHFLHVKMGVLEQIINIFYRLQNLMIPNYFSSEAENIFGFADYHMTI